MVAEASKFPVKDESAPVYDLRSFRSRDSVGALIGIARKTLAAEFDRELAGLGLNTVQALVIVLLADEVARTAAGMARELSHDAGAMTRIIDKLEEQGIVRRVPREHDRRATDLELTKEGRRLHGEVRRVQVAVLNRVLRGFSKNDVRALERLLKRVIDNAGGTVTVEE